MPRAVPGLCVRDVCAQAPRGGATARSPFACVCLPAAVALCGLERPSFVRTLVLCDGGNVRVGARRFGFCFCVRRRGGCWAGMCGSDVQPLLILPIGTSGCVDGQFAAFVSGGAGCHVWCAADTCWAGWGPQVWFLLLRAAWPPDARLPLLSPACSRRHMLRPSLGRTVPHR